MPPARPSKIAPAITAAAVDKSRLGRCQLHRQTVPNRAGHCDPPIMGHYDAQQCRCDRVKSRRETSGKPARTGHCDPLPLSCPTTEPLLPPTLPHPFHHSFLRIYRPPLRGR